MIFFIISDPPFPKKWRGGGGERKERKGVGGMEGRGGREGLGRRNLATTTTILSETSKQAAGPRRVQITTGRARVIKRKVG